MRADFSRGGEAKILVEQVRVISENDLNDFKKNGTPKNAGSLTAMIKQRLYIRLEDSDNQPILLTLKEKLDGHKGETEVVLVTGAKDSKQIIKLPQTIDINEASLRELASLFGSTNVVVR